MPKELYIYEPLYSYTQKDIIAQINAFGDEEFVTRIDCPGGEVSAGWSIISKLSELSQKKKAVMDGNASSMAAIMLLFFDELIVNDTSEGMFHKAAYPSWYDPTESEAESLVRINKIFREKLEATKMPSDIIERIFMPDVRNDVYVSAQELVDYAIATEIRTLDIAEREACRNKATAMAFARSSKNENNQTDNSNKTNKKMTAEEFKVSNPDAYASIVEVGQKQERTRVNAFLHTISAEEKSLSARSISAIKNGEQYIEAMPELNSLAIAETRKAAAIAENIEDVEGEDTPPGADGKELNGGDGKSQLDKDQAEVNALLGIKIK